MASITHLAMRGSLSHRGPLSALSSTESTSLNALPGESEGFVAQPILAVLLLFPSCIAALLPFLSSTAVLCHEDLVAQPILAVLLASTGSDPYSLQVRKIEAPSGCQ